MQIAQVKKPGNKPPNLRNSFYLLQFLQASRTDLGSWWWCCWLLGPELLNDFDLGFVSFRVSLSVFFLVFALCMSSHVWHIFTCWLCSRWDSGEGCEGDEGVARNVSWKKQNKKGNMNPKLEIWSKFREGRVTFGKREIEKEDQFWADLDLLRDSFSEGKGQLLGEVTFSMRSEPWCKICSASNTPAAKDWGTENFFARYKCGWASQETNFLFLDYRIVNSGGRKILLSDFFR